MALKSEFETCLHASPADIYTIACLQTKKELQSALTCIHLKPQNPKISYTQQHPFPLHCSPPQIARLLLNIESSIRLPQRLHLPVAQFLVDFLHIHQFLDGEDLTRDVGCYGVVDGAQTLVQAEGFEDAAGFPGQTDGRAHEGDAEEGGGGWGGHFCDAIE
jgi:hypothetical protein